MDRFAAQRYMPVRVFPCAHANSLQNRSHDLGTPSPGQAQQRAVGARVR